MNPPPAAEPLGHFRPEALEKGELLKGAPSPRLSNRSASREAALYSPGDGRRPQRELCPAR
jgi:hypothetical protein